jgi:hypothetical protein
MFESFQFPPSRLSRLTSGFFIRRGVESALSSNDVETGNALPLGLEVVAQGKDPIVE